MDIFLEFFICEEHKSIDFWVKNHTTILIYPFRENQHYLAKIKIDDILYFWLCKYNYNEPFIQGSSIFNNDEYSHVKILYDGISWTIIVDDNLDGTNVFPIRLPSKYYF